MFKRKATTVEPLRLSWSAIQSFLACQRRYELSYRENLQRQPNAAQGNLLLGSAVHAGIETALRASFEERHPATAWEVGIRAARRYVQQATVPNRTIRDSYGTTVPDYEYYSMVKEVEAVAAALLDFHYPQFEIGERFTVPTIAEVLSNTPPAKTHLRPIEDPNDQPAIEWHFELPLDADTILSGYIDTVLWDVVEQEYVMVDWKTRTQFPSDMMAMIDGQLHLYAGVVNAMAGFYGTATPINKLLMWQLRAKPPQPASISKRNGLPNTGAASYDTTWEIWSATLPRNIRAADYAEIMEGKLKEARDFQRVIPAVVTETSTKLALDNVLAAVASIRAAIATGKPMAAILSANGCKFCDFAMLCANAFRYGGDVAPLVEQFYQPRIADIVEEIVE